MSVTAVHAVDRPRTRTPTRRCTRVGVGRRRAAGVRERGESKAAVARGAGLGEPAVRRLFSGRHANPTVKTLEAVAAHLGLRLSLEQQPRALAAPTLAELRASAGEIRRLVEAHGGRNVRVFGSVARGEAGPGSDVDLLVEVEPGTGLLELGAMEDELAQALDRQVDVVDVGEAAQNLEDLADHVPGGPWAQIARMRDRVAHRYFDVDYDVVWDTLTTDLSTLERAVRAFGEHNDG